MTSHAVTTVLEVSALLVIKKEVISMVEFIGWLAIGAGAFYLGYLKGQGKI